MSKTYVGVSDEDGMGGRVFVEEKRTRRELGLRLDIRNHSPTGFSWGFTGSGPAQCALAILADLIGPATALCHYMRFKDEVLTRLSQNKGWRMRESEVLRWFAGHVSATEVGEEARDAGVFEHRFVVKAWAGPTYHLEHHQGWDSLAAAEADFHGIVAAYLPGQVEGCPSRVNLLGRARVPETGDFDVLASANEYGLSTFYPRYYEAWREELGGVTRTEGR
jgi:hypothetical protein